MFPFKIAAIVIYIIISSQQISSPASIKKEGCDFVDLFKQEQYKKIIELSKEAEILNECEKLLLAKSFERLGFISRSNRILKEIFNQNSRYRDYAAYFIAKNYETLNDFPNAMRWYRNILFKTHESRNTSWSSIDNDVSTTIAFERLGDLVLRDRRFQPQVLRIFKKTAKNNAQANYYIGVLYHKAGDVDRAAEYYSSIIREENVHYLKSVLEHVTDDFRLIEMLSKKGLKKTYLINLCISNKLYDGALLISYLLPYSAYVAHLRAYCFYKIGDYKSSAVMYNEYYSNFTDVEALVKIAYSYFYIGEKSVAASYLLQYIEEKGGTDNITADAFYLKLQLEKNGNNIRKYIQESEYFISKYNNYWQTDRFIQDTYYYILHKKETRLAVSFLKGSYFYIKAPMYKAWSLYVLGIYFDKKFLTEAIDQFPGSYYYFMALEKADIDRKLIRSADQYLTQGKMNEALDMYIRLFSKRIQEKYVKGRIVHIISKKPPYSYLFIVDRIRSGSIDSVLFEFYNYGLHDELQELINESLIIGNQKEKILFYYILSKISYESGDAYKGVSYAEKMINLVGKKYLLFFPEEILRQVYPYLYYETLSSYFSDNPSPYIDYCMVLSIIREESRFNSRARSPKGALGLMQLMPETAAWINNQKLNKKELFNPSVNIKIGMLYLDYLNERFNTEASVLAAYNGGPANVNRWLSSGSNDNIQQFIEEIPFSETRNYVKKVLTTYTMYKMIYGSNCR